MKFVLKNKTFKSCFAFQSFPTLTNFASIKFGGFKRDYVSRKLEAKVPEIRPNSLDTGTLALLFVTN